MQKYSLWSKKNWCKWYCFRANIITFFRTLKWSIQRVKRGYADCDLWNFDDYCAELIGAALMQLKDATDCYPDEFENFEDWQNEIAGIATCLLETDSWSPGEKYHNKYEEDYEKIKHVPVYTQLENGLTQISFEHTPEEQVLLEKYMIEANEKNQLRSADRNAALCKMVKYWNHFND